MTSSPTEAQQRFSGEITVASRIVDDLSSGLYDSPAACLKELVNNSYDADATDVQIFVKPDADRIIIEDNGVGLSRDEFERHFSTISQSYKRDDSDVTALGRPKIGKIGIGFIAANEICDVMEITSTKAGSSELLRVEINFSEMRRDPAERRREATDVAKGDYQGVVESTDRHDHYTRVFLKDVRGGAREILAGAARIGTSKHAPSLYGLRPKSIADRLASIQTWDDLDLYSQTLLRVGLNVPVRYLDDWMPEVHRPDVRPFERAVERLNFQVSYDGTELRKPLVLGRDQARTLVHAFTHDGKDVGLRGYFFAQHGVLRPKQINGVLIRIRNAAVGEYDSGYLGFPSSTGTLFQRWISGEVWADDRLEESMNIDRRTFQVTDSAYHELQDVVHRELAEVLRRARGEIYETQSRRRRRAQARREIKRVEALVETTELPAATARAVTSRWDSALERPTATQAVLKRYSVSELFEIAVEVAAETLSRQDFRRFVNALTERLTR